MEKKRNMVGTGGLHPGLTKLIKIMKLTTFLFFLAITQVFAETSYAQATRLTLDMENAAVKDVLFEIEENSEFYFVYSNKLIDVERKVNLKVENKKVSQILDSIFEGEDVKYSVNDRQIILSPEGLELNDSGVAFQQSKTISGTVKSESGDPLPGVTIVVKGTTNGTVSGGDGSFTLNVGADAETLIFSFVGMTAQEIVIGSQTFFDVVMLEETIGLEEVIAIGYGTIKKSDLTGAVGSVQGDALTERNTTQISQALQGSMSGLQVTRSNNAPGSTATIRIRGITSIGDSNPLIIVDGVPVDNINDINPNDVQDISVLKDAASASIYGARAAAGVILVTTKRAKTGEIGLQYNLEYGFERPTQLPDYVDVTRYLKLANELRWNDNGNTENEYPLYPKDLVDNYLSLNAQDPNNYPNTDWQELIINSSAPRQSHVLSVTAGTKAVRMKASLAYDKTDALYDGRSYERITARFNNDVTINKFLSASLDFYFKRSISNNASIDPMYMTLISAPVYAAEWTDGRVAEGKTGANIYGSLKYGGYNNTWSNDVGGKVAVDFTPLEGLKISAILSPSLGFDKGKRFRKKVEYYSAEDPTVYGGTLQWNPTTLLQEARNDNYRVTTQFLANYIKSFGDHNLTALAGYENYYAFNENQGASRDQYELSS
ncbi:SusC/RagA family TonB-linked outer membrane protein, partial [Draconibacterium sp.]|nr:SusC/RagA family TonB-linked outer membrane protein [Draconibacterium sp.]